jgi:hypothetical protein
MLLFLIQTYAVFDGRPFLFLVQMYERGPLYVCFINSTWTYAGPHRCMLLFEISFE